MRLTADTKAVNVGCCHSWDRRGEQGEAYCQQSQGGFEEGPPFLGCGVWTRDTANLRKGRRGFRHPDLSSPTLWSPLLSSSLLNRNV